MILLTLGLLGFGVVDLIRWAPGRVSMHRAVMAIAGGVVAASGFAALAGLCFWQVMAVAFGAVLALGLWVAFDYPQARRGGVAQLVWIAGVLVLLFALSGTVDPIEGSFESWYEDLGFGFVDAVPVDQFALGIGSAIFLTATANRVVRLTLDSAVVSWERSETALAGGRLLGPLERLMIAAIVLAGDPAAAAIVVTAKGLLRFPEIRGEAKRGPDAVTEYFLIGTFTSLLLAAILAVVVLAAT